MRNNNSINLQYVSIALIIVIYKFWILKVFTTIYIDSDQTIMWAGTKDFANGSFHETRYYGQDYNSMLEALISSLFYSLGIKLKYLLPAITSILAMTPFVVLSWLTFKKRSKVTGLIILCLTLFFSFKYDLLTTLPRGFVTGIFLYSFIFPFVFRKQHTSGTFFWITFIILLAFTVNANSILIGFVITLYFFLKNYLNRNYYIYSFLAICCGGVVIFSIDLFYYLHPNYVLHKGIMTFDLGLIKEGIQRLDVFFNDVTPIFWRAGWILLPVFCVISMYFYQKDRSLFLVSAIFPIILLLTLAVSKVYDGTESVFFTYSRMYLSVPLIIAFLFSFIDFNKNIGVLSFALSILFVSSKVTNSSKWIESSIGVNTVVAVAKVKDFEAECAKLKSLTQKYNLDLIVIINDNFYDFINYGCGCVENKFPNTIRPIYERRTWRLEEDENVSYKNILFIDNKLELKDSETNIILIDRERGYFLLKGNKLKTKRLFKNLKIKTRNY